jgi:hypothetical protein
MSGRANQNYIKTLSELKRALKFLYDFGTILSNVAKPLNLLRLKKLRLVYLSKLFSFRRCSDRRSAETGKMELKWKLQL